MAVKVRKVRQAVLFDLEGSLTFGQPVEELGAQIQEQLDGGSKNFAINLTGIKYIDSSGISALVSAHTSALKAEGRCVLFGAPERVISAFRVAGLESFVEIAGDEVSALARLLEPDLPGGTA